ncbi:MAG: hypothetical protein EXS31_03660 [Pedosphaera sp.]|nr:hypothetical protein [Pedosphaera sp.]
MYLEVSSIFTDELSCSQACSRRSPNATVPAPRSRAFGKLHRLLLMTLWACLLPLIANGEVLWQLGHFDESSAEFSPINDPQTGSRRIDYSDASQDPVFVIGVSDPARHWFSYQPGSANGGTGFRRHPFTIQFNLPQQPVSDLRLVLALLAYSTRLPSLHVEINGHTGVFHQEPKLAYSAGDQAVFFLPHYATSRIEALLPAKFLRSGANQLILTAIDEPGDRDDVRPSGYPWPGNSGIVYDAICLESIPTGAALSPEPVRILPTIFYHQKEAQLTEQVDVVIRKSDGPAPQTVTFIVGGWTRTEPLAWKGDFGEIRVAFVVPEFTSDTEAQVRFETGATANEFKTKISPRRKWEIMVVPNEHLDIGYTDHDWKVAELHAQTVDDAIRLAREHPDFQFTFDGFWVIDEFLRSRNAAQQQQFIQLVRERRLHVPVVHGSTFTGFSSLENLIRGLYPSKAFAVRHGLPFDSALITDVPACSWSFASVLGAAGVKYLAAASDAYRGPFLLYNRFHEHSPEWWEGPDGGRVLTWYSRHYHQVASLFGMPPQLAQGRESLPRFLQAYDHVGYRANTVILYGTHVENVELHPAQTTFVGVWNRAFAYPKLRYAGLAEATEQIVRQSGGNPSSHRGDGGPYWEDGLGANARITALARRNMQRVLSAEIFSTLNTRINPLTTPNRDRQAEIWRNLLITDEHSWHADQSTRDPGSEQSLRQGEAKDFRSILANRLIDEHLGQALAGIAHATPFPAGSLLLFNSLSWPRRSLVELDLPKGQGIWDEDKKGFIPVEPLRAGNQFERIRFLSPEIPGVGYRQLSFKSATLPLEAAAQTVPQSSLENDFYLVELDAASGAVRRIFDKELKLELVDVSNPFRFNHHIYVTGADTPPNRLVQFSTVSPIPELKLSAASGGRIKDVRKTGFGTVALLESTNLNTPRIETEIILFDALKRIEIINRIQKLKTYAKEGVYFAFPFTREEARFRYATQNGFVDPARDMLPGAGLEWFNVQQWLAVEANGFVASMVPVDAPLVTLGDIARGTWPREFGRRPGTVFSYVMNNYTPEGYLAGQGGEFTFRYVLSSAREFDPVALHRLGTEALVPVERNEILRNERALPPAQPPSEFQQSLIRVDQPNISLVTWKTGERGEGTILRFLEVAGNASNVDVHFPKAWQIRRAVLCNAVEDEQTVIEATGSKCLFPIRPFGIATLKVEFAK